MRLGTLYIRILLVQYAQKAFKTNSWSDFWQSDFSCFLFCSFHFCSFSRNSKRKEGTRSSSTTLWWWSTSSEIPAGELSTLPTSWSWQSWNRERGAWRISGTKRIIERSWNGGILHVTISYLGKLHYLL